MSIVVITNPTPQEIDTINDIIPGDEVIIQKIKRNNTKVEFIEKQNFIFAILYLPEYHSEKKSIKSVEVNIYFNKTTKKIYIFAYNTLYFFERYHENILGIEYKTFGTFIKKFLDVILEDESKIVEHIVEDTETVKEEYYRLVNTYEIIRHLTQNEINISSLKLISASQNKFLDLLEKHISGNGFEAIEYKRSYVSEELEYMHEFCKALMDSINTKFQVRSSEELYIFTRNSFIIFILTLIVAFLTLAEADGTHNKVFTTSALILGSLAMVIVLYVFRRPH